MSDNFQKLRTIMELMKKSEVKSPESLAEGTKYLLMVFKTTVIDTPADKRAIESGGSHGYSAETTLVNQKNVYGFTDKEDLMVVVNHLLTKDPGRNDLLILEINKKIEVGQRFEIKI